MKKYLVTGIICLLVIVISATMSFSMIDSVNDQIDMNTAKINTLTNQLELVRSNQTNTDKKIVLTETGFDADRVSLDDGAAREFMSHVFNWSSNAEYVKARDSIKDTYGLTDDSAFMTTFMPEPYVSVARDGTEYPQIDLLGLNAEFDDMTIQVRNIAKDTYSYFARVTWHAKIADGTIASTESVFLFDTNEDHELMNLEAYNLR